MVRLRTVVAANIRAYRIEKGLSQMKLADIVDISTNYLVMLEKGKRFPSDTMIEKLAVALQREPLDFFSITPVQAQWEIDLLTEISAVINAKLQEAQRKNPDK